MSSFSYSLLLCCTWHVSMTMTGSDKDKPNIFFIYADDLGFGNVGWNNPNNPEVITPNLNQLAINEGLILNRHYAHYVCSPSRSSLQSGRLPCHIVTEGAPGIYTHGSLKNPNPTIGVPQNMTCIATKMKNASYTTHIVGKWHIGYATETHLPSGRGYDTSMVYLNAANDYFTQELPEIICNGTPTVDFWGNGQPLYGKNNTKYEEFLFEEEINTLLDSFTQQKDPFFLMYTPHIVHAPQQIPQQYLSLHDNDEYNCSALDTYVYPGFNNSNGNDVNYRCRSIYESMVTLLDTIIGNITLKLKQNGLWDNTLLIFSSDNGGPLQLPCCSGNNYPLRGGKHSVWEGGIRMAAFVSGGYLPKKRIGQIENGMIAVADWYTTFCAMVGVDPFDENGAKHNLPPVEGFNMWPLISGSNGTSPRVLLPIDTSTVIVGDYKLIYYDKVDQASWGGVFYPNTTSSSLSKGIVGTKMNCSKGCLFDVVNDYTEHIDLSSQYPNMVQEMNNTLNQLIKGYYVNNDTLYNSCPNNIGGEMCTANDLCHCYMVENKYNGFTGPWCHA